MRNPNPNAKCNAQAKTNAEVESEESRKQLAEKLDKENIQRQDKRLRAKQSRSERKRLLGFVRITILSDAYPL
jgi:hypothetical protein